MAKGSFDVFDPCNGRWPEIGDHLFSHLPPGRGARLAQNADERSYRITRGYKRAGDLLIKNALEDPADHHNLVYPIAFCYRHYVELALKAIIEDHGPFVGIILSKKDHAIKDLWMLFEQLDKAYGNDDSIVEPAVAACIDELASVDPSSFSFRYARTKKGELINLSENGIDLISLHDVMNGIENFFECADADFSHKKDSAFE